MSRLLRVGFKVWLFFFIALAGVLSFIFLKIEWSDLFPDRNGWALAGKFFSGALMPALDYQTTVPEGTDAFWWKILKAMVRTVFFAITALSLGAVLAIPLAILGSNSIWRGVRSGWGKKVEWFIKSVVRLFQVSLRSVHELLWAVLFLAAFGLSDLTAVLALAIPYAGILSKIYGEILDETPQASWRALKGLGGGWLQAFFLGLLPRAMPDMVSYTFYRFECAVRASAVLGFVGISTLGLYLKLSFENGQYREVWSYLYALLFLIFILDWWSSEVRKRLH